MSAGLGAVDIAAFALRVASWSLAQRSHRNVLLLDEPFKHLKGTAQNRRAINLLHQVSQELGLQIITISDERAPREDITSGADRTIEVSKVEGRSQARVVD
jgi:DNA repair exonuclease SbcCD ATPase subunit